MNIISLEPRRLFAVASHFDSVTGVFRIQSDDAADEVHLALIGGGQFGVVVNGQQAASAEIDAVRKVVFYGSGGNDLFTVGRVPVRLYADGGTGSDSISGGSRDDTLLGNDGKDYLFGAGRNDVLDGGLGGDRMLGGHGDDLVYIHSEVPTDDFASGGRGNDKATLEQYTHGTTNIVGLLNPTSQQITDVILGDFETIQGSAFNDAFDIVSGRATKIFGGAGNDTITGGSGADELHGEAGFDVLSGAGGDDLLIGADDTNTRDTLNGGTGDDTAIASPLDILNSVKNVTLSYA